MSGSFDEMLAELEKDRPSSAQPSPTGAAPPGPWRHESYPANPDKFWTILDRNGTEIGYAKDSTDAPNSVPKTAALMCAAPDMLEVLKKVIAIAGHQWADLDLGAILAKAEGR